MIQIIDYGAGNIKSVFNALEKLGFESKVVDSAEKLDVRCKTIFPGVGAAGSAMKQLQERGFVDVLVNFDAPFLGICLGMQLLMDFSYEDEVECLGIISGMVREFPDRVKVPQIGWNRVVQCCGENLLFKDVPDRSYFYFVNSYYVGAGVNVVGSTNYGVNFASVVNRDNFYGVQFHPEKSGKVGLKLLNNFCELC